MESLDTVRRAHELLDLAEDRERKAGEQLARAEEACAKHQALVGQLQRQSRELDKEIDNHSQLSAILRTQIGWYDVATKQLNAMIKLLELARTTAAAMSDDPEVVANVVAIAEEAIKLRQQAEWAKFAL